MRTLVSFLVGGLFGAGLLVSGMTDTAKVQGFLDFFGHWDVTLAFVMGGAIAPMALAWRLTRHRRPVLGGAFPAQPAPVLDTKLIGGSVLFGIGWGLAGLCPGPALASLFWAGTSGLVFAAAMILGMIATPPLRKRLDARPQEG
ncbi:DUF6691 family protein [Loktanella sp. M215]|uniref:DUF6691 family protein n=1 Tax=Loktanella sp. M215 TaxID=2675431 RepID=UPI001F358A5E|nr:DUF6691 family protein [Loktanella sp. M215]MCF7699824.1 hypothetical protein [Loktanella sp. M215]